jgi:hypothetical protein
MIEFELEREGLDLSDPEDRAIFRQRVAHSLRLCSLNGLRDHCKELNSGPNKVLNCAQGFFLYSLRSRSR